MAVITISVALNTGKIDGKIEYSPDVPIEDRNAFSGVSTLAGAIPVLEGKSYALANEYTGAQNVLFLYVKD